MTKFSQKQILLNALLSTGTAGLTEGTFDRFWGCGTHKFNKAYGGQMEWK